MEFRLFQDVTIPGDADSATLSWQSRFQWNFTIAGGLAQPRTVDVEVRDPATGDLLATVFAFSTGPETANPTGNTGWQTHTADLSAFIGQTVRVQFREAVPQPGSGPAQAEFDAISLIASSEPAIQNLDASGAVLGHAAAAPVSTETIAFSEVTPRPADGAVIKGVTFDYKIGGVDSTAAGIGLSTGPGATNNLSPPLLEGPAFGILAMDFAEPVVALEFGFALSNTISTPSALTVQLFDESNVLVETITVAGAPDPTFTGGKFSYSGDAISRAVVDFNESIAGAFALDNVVFSTPSDGPADVYEITANVGDMIDLSTLTPGDGPHEFENGFDPKIELVDPNGDVVATDDNSGPDGRNAALTHPVTISGKYLVRILSPRGPGGEYVLRALAAPTVESILYFNENAAAEKNFTADGTGQRSIVKQIQVTFAGSEVVVPLGPVTDKSFVLESVPGGSAVGLEVLSRLHDPVAKKTIVTLGVLSGSPLVNAFGSLNDGRYQLTIDGALLGVDGDGDGALGGEAVDEFFRFFGDSDGDRDVDNRDQANYLQTIRGTAGFAKFIPVFDFNNDDNVQTGGATGIDLTEFRKRYGKRI
jgi:hypothetical protein